MVIDLAKIDWGPIIIALITFAGGALTAAFAFLKGIWPKSQIDKRAAIVAADLVVETAREAAAKADQQAAKYYADTLTQMASDLTRARTELDRLSERQARVDAKNDRLETELDKARKEIITLREKEARNERG